MKGIDCKKLLLRSFSVLLGVFAVVFGVTWKKSGFCLGDRILAGAGLPAWSEGKQGTHYSAVIALILLFAAFFIFSRTMKDRRNGFRLIIVVCLGVIVLMNFLTFMVQV